MRALKRLGIDWKDRNLIANDYLKRTAVVRIGDELSELSVEEYDNDVRSPLSSLISTLRSWLENAMEKTQEGITVGGRTVKAVRCVDDQAVVAETQKALQKIMTVLHDTSQDYGMRINVKKTKVMHISRKEGRKLTIAYGLKVTNWTKLNNFYVRQLC